MIFLGHMDRLFMNSGFFCIEWACRGFQICDWKLFPNSILLSWRKLCAVISKSYWHGTLVSTAWFSSPLNENFSPDGSILVIWIFRALFEILRQPICKRRDAQLPCIQRAIRDSDFWLCPSSAHVTRLPLGITGGSLELFGCLDMQWVEANVWWNVPWTRECTWQREKGW